MADKSEKEGEDIIKKLIQSLETKQSLSESSVPIVEPRATQMLGQENEKLITLDTVPIGASQQIKSSIWASVLAADKRYVAFITDQGYLQIVSPIEKDRWKRVNMPLNKVNSVALRSIKPQVAICDQSGLAVHEIVDRERNLEFKQKMKFNSNIKYQKIILHEKREAYVASLNDCEVTFWNISEESIDPKFHKVYIQSQKCQDITFIQDYLAITLENHFLKILELPEGKIFSEWKPHNDDFKVLSNSFLEANEILITVNSSSVSVWNYKGQFITKKIIDNIPDRYSCLDSTGQFVILASRFELICLHLQVLRDITFDSIKKFRLESPPLALACRNRLPRSHQSEVIYFGNFELDIVTINADKGAVFNVLPIWQAYDKSVSIKMEEEAKNGYKQQLQEEPYLKKQHHQQQIYQQPQYQEKQFQQKFNKHYEQNEQE